MNQQLVERYAELCAKKVRIGDSTRWEWAAKRTAEIEAEQEKLFEQMTHEEIVEARRRYQNWFRKYMQG